MFGVMVVTGKNSRKKNQKNRNWKKRTRKKETVANNKNPEPRTGKVSRWSPEQENR
jgi:hypothetical protein